MATLITPEQATQRTERAVDAAVQAGRGLGLTVTDPTVLYDVFSVIVQLKPSDVVARVPVVLPPGRGEPAAVAQRQRIELDVVGWLAEQDVPVVAPSPRVPAAPVVTEEFSLTLWRHVDVEAETELDVVANARMIPRLHEALRGYPGRLPFLPQVSWIPDSLAFLAANPGLAAADDLDRAQREWQVLGPIVASPASLVQHCGEIGMQPLHGDAPAVNMLATKAGMLYADFEDPVWGPIEFDLAFMGPEAVAAYDEAAGDRGLRPTNPEVLRLIEAVANVQVVACFAMMPQLPVLAEYLEYSLPQWRESPFAGGLS